MRKKLLEPLGTLFLLGLLIYQIVFEERDSDIVFDAGGKATIIIIFIIFVTICFFQDRKRRIDDK